MSYMVPVSHFILFPAPILCANVFSMLPQQQQKFFLHHMSRVNISTGKATM